MKNVNDTLVMEIFAAASNFAIISLKMYRFVPVCSVLYRRGELYHYGTKNTKWYILYRFVPWYKSPHPTVSLKLAGISQTEALKLTAPAGSARFFAGHVFFISD